MHTIFLICSKSDLSGAPLHVATIANELLLRGFRIHLFFSGNGQAFHNVRDKVKQYELKGLDNDASVLDTLNAIRYIRKACEHSNPDVLHAHSTKAGLITRVASFGRSHRTIFTVHGWGFGPGRPGKQSVLAVAIELVLGLLKTDRYICVSQADRDLGIKYLPWLKQKMSIIHNGIDCLHQQNFEKNHKFSDIINITMIARTGYQKNHATVSRAFSMLNNNFKLKLVGTGTDSPEFINSFTNNMPQEMINRISFLGQRSDIPQILDKTDIFLLCSRFEGLPISIIEAMRAGLPIVTTDVGGNNELIQNNGYLTQPGEDEAKQIYQALTNLQNKAERLKFGRNSENLFKSKFQTSTMIEKILIEYGFFDA